MLLLLLHSIFSSSLFRKEKNTTQSDQESKLNYSDEEKRILAHENQMRIYALQRVIVEDYQEEIKPQIIYENDVERILKSYNPNEEYIEVKFHNERKGDPMI